MKHLKLFLLFTLFSAFAFGQTTPTLPSGSYQVQPYKNPNGKNYVGNAAKNFEVIALQRSLDSIQNLINIAIGLKVDKTTTVNGHALSGNVTVTKGDVGLGNVDNTSDAAKPVSTATQTALNGKQASLGFTPENLANKAVAGGYASLDGSGRVPLSQLPTGTQTYVGTWNASTNTPALANGVGTLGQYVIVNVTGTQNLGSGSETYALGDNVIYSGSVWEKVPNSGGVTSVNGMTGAVSLTTGNIPESGNLYYTEAKVNANTNVAANTAARHPAVTIGTGNGLSLSTQALSLGLASTSTTGALSSTDWNTFNGKQAAGSYQAQLNGTGFVKASGTTISYDNSSYLTTSSASATYEPIFSKNTGFNKNFGTGSGTVAQGNDSRIINGQTAFGWGNHAGLYPTYNGTGATGTWPISVTGNAATSTNSDQWGAQNYSGTTNPLPSGEVLAYSGVDNSWHPTSLAQLGFNPGGETLQNVWARGATIKAATDVNLNIGIGANPLAMALSAINDAGNANTPLELRGSSINIAPGNVGIDVANPSAKLDVNGTGNFSGNVTAANLSGTNTGDQDLSNLVDLTSSQSIEGAKFFHTGGVNIAASANSGIPFRISDSSTRFYFDSNGKAIYVDAKTYTSDRDIPDVGKVNSLISASLASPAFTGTPTAPTAAPGTNTTQVATTAFVQAALTSGRYTPTFTAISGSSALTSLGDALYQKIGNIVSVSGRVNVTMSSSFVEFRISLPIASSLALTADASGSAVGYSSTFGVGNVYANPTDDNVTVVVVLPASGSTHVAYNFMYEIK